MRLGYVRARAYVAVVLLHEVSFPLILRDEGLEQVERRVAI